MFMCFLFIVFICSQVSSRSCEKTESQQQKPFRGNLVSKHLNSRFRPDYFWKYVRDCTWYAFFLRHVMRSNLSVRPKCSHRCVSRKETPRNLSKSSSAQPKTQLSKPLWEQTCLKISRFKIVQEPLILCWSRRYAERIWGYFFFILVRRIVGKLPANFSANLMANFDREFLRPCFFQGFRPPNKFTPKIHVQNCRHSSPISLSWTPNVFMAIFCLRGRPKYVISISR